MQKAIHFKGLNGVRAIASLLVVIWHIDQFTELFNKKSFGFHSNGMAGYAVDMFFVLSGFLITFLLFKEKESTNTINLKKFYLRRIYRIWPVYYISLFITAILIYLNIIPSSINPLGSFTLYAFLMANIAYILKLSLSTITPLWSVGVEEQFYLIWPHLIKRFTNYLYFFIVFFLGFIVIKLIIYVLLSPSSIIYNFLVHTRINIMSMGAMGAYLVYSKSKLLKIIYRIDVQIISWIVLIASILYKPIHIISFLDSELNSIFYFVIILNLATNSKSILSLDNRVLNFLGKISYGMYVYHMIVICIMAYILNHIEYQFNIYTIYCLIIVSNIVISYISFTYFESYFLTMKNKYTIIKSSNTL